MYGYFWFTVVRYFLYLLKCGHIAVLTELITKNEIGNGGTNMFQYGKNVVVQRFSQVNVLFGIDLLITGVVKPLTAPWILSVPCCSRLTCRRHCSNPCF